jgi:hypothetical protein
MAQDAKRSDEDRAEYRHQEKLWLQIADQADKNNKANRTRIALHRAGDDTK